MSDNKPEFAYGDKVRKVTGDYQLDGVVVGVIVKLNGVIRYAVEHEQGFIHIYAEQNIKKI